MEQTNNNEKPIHMDEKLEKLVKSYNTVSILAIVQSILSIIMGAIVIFVSDETKSESIGVKIFAIFLAIIPAILELIAGILGLKVKKDPASVTPSWILYIVSLIVMLIESVVGGDFSVGYLALAIFFLALYYGYQIRKCLKEGTPNGQKAQETPDKLEKFNNDPE